MGACWWAKDGQQEAAQGGEADEAGLGLGGLVAAAMEGQSRGGCLRPSFLPTAFFHRTPPTPHTQPKTGADGLQRKTRLPAALRQPARRPPPPHAQARARCYAVLKMGSLALYRGRDGPAPEAVMVFEPGTRVEVRACVSC